MLESLVLRLCLKRDFDPGGFLWILQNFKNAFLQNSFWIVMKISINVLGCQIKENTLVKKMYRLLYFNLFSITKSATLFCQKKIFGNFVFKTNQRRCQGHWKHLKWRAIFNTSILDVCRGGPVYRLTFGKLSPFGYIYALVWVYVFGCMHM